MTTELVPGWSVLRDNMMIFGLYSLKNRAIPILPDGLKVSQRAILYSAYTLGLKPTGKTLKSTRVVSTCMSLFHPHGDQSLYKTLANMTCDEKVNVPLFDGLGNWGHFGGSPAAARYTETRLSQPGWLAMDTIKDHAVDMVDNFDQETVQPEFLPTKVPILAMNGTSGIGEGFACVHLPYNPTEVMDTLILLASHKRRVPLSLVREVLHGPDFVGGGTVVVDSPTWESLMVEGSGRVIYRSTVTIEDHGGESQLVVSTLPWGVANETFVSKVKDLVRNKKIDGVSSINDHSGGNGIQITIGVKKGTNPQTVLTALYALTPLESTFSANGNVIDEDGNLVKVGLLSLLRSHLNMRIHCIRRVAENRKKAREKKLHMVEGLLKVLVDIDRAVSIIRNSTNQNAAAKNLIKEFSIDADQAEHVLSLPLRKLTRMDSKELKTERKNLTSSIAEDQKITEDTDYLTRRILIPELKEVRKVVSKDRACMVKEVSETVKTVKPEPAQDELGDYWVTVTDRGLKRLERDNGHATLFHGDKNLIGVTENGWSVSVNPQLIHSTASMNVLTRGTLPEDAGNFTHLYAEAPLFLYVTSSKAKLCRPQAKTTPLGKEPPIIFEPAGEQYLLLVTQSGRVLKIDTTTLPTQGPTGGGVQIGHKNMDHIVDMLTATDEDTITTVTDMTTKVTRVSDIPPHGRTSLGVIVHKLRKGEGPLRSAHGGGESPTPLARSGVK